MVATYGSLVEYIVFSDCQDFNCLEAQGLTRHN